MSEAKLQHVCTSCGRRTARWAGRCPGCGGWGTVEPASIRTAAGRAGPLPLPTPLTAAADDGRRLGTGFEGLDRVLGGGLAPGSVVLLAGEPGIGKSTLLLQVLAYLSAAGLPCLLASGEESHAQVAARAGRLGIAGEAISFIPGRDLPEVVGIATSTQPSVLAVDSIQTLRDPAGSQVPGGVAQVRGCADALIGMAKSEGTTVLLTGHVTKDGDLAGPRALEHAVDVVLTFEGDARSGRRVLAGGKNRFGAEGEATWFEMGSEGLREIDPTRLLVSGDGAAGAATALPQIGRRALAVEVQALIGSVDGPARRQATGLDPRRFQLIAAVLDRVAGFKLGRSELFGAASGGIRVEDPACDLAVAVALASAAVGIPPPERCAFVGEISLTGLVRPAPVMGRRIAAARAAGCAVVVAGSAVDPPVSGVRIRTVRRLTEALTWAFRSSSAASGTEHPSLVGRTA